MRVVVVCGAFDPFPHIGHLEHIRLAKKLGDYLIVILNPDEDVIRKRGIVYTPMGQRLKLLQSLRDVDEVVIAIDGDGTVARTLLMLKPDILAKGGDRRETTMPTNELEVCKAIGCEIVYGVGEILESSTNLLKRFKTYRGKVKHNPSGDFK